MIKQADRQKLFSSLKKKFYSSEAILATAEKYKDVFTDLDGSQVVALVEHIVVMIVGSFNSVRYSMLEEKLKRAELVKKMCEEMSLDEIGNLDHNFRKLYFLNKQARHIISFFEDRKLQPKGEINRFLELAQDVTKEMGELVGNTVLATISFAEKNNIVSQNNDAQENEQSWVLRVGGNKKETKRVSFDESVIGSR